MRIVNSGLDRIVVVVYNLNNHVTQFMSGKGSCCSSRTCNRKSTWWRGPNLIYYGIPLMTVNMQRFVCDWVINETHQVCGLLLCVESDFTYTNWHTHTHNTRNHTRLIICKCFILSNFFQFFFLVWNSLDKSKQLCSACCQLFFWNGFPVVIEKWFCHFRTFLNLDVDCMRWHLMIRCDTWFFIICKTIRFHYKENLRVL